MRGLLLCSLLTVAGCEAQGPAPTWQEAANASYAGLMGLSITLEDGEWQGEPYVEGGASAPRAGLVRDFLLTGDLDHDGAAESVVLVWTSSGGSGTFDYLAVVERADDGTVSERASAPLGDRVQVRRADIVGGAVVLDVVQAGPDDARCCPGQLMRRTFVLEGDAMKERSTGDRGRLSLADLDGEWTLLEMRPGGMLPDGVNISARFEAGEISGKAACNRYTGRVEAGDAPGDLSLAGPLAATRMMCPPEMMEWEDRYLQALQGLRKFSFTAGRLVLTGTDGVGLYSLEFAPNRTPR